jgi:hypothetical protein
MLKITTDEIEEIINQLASAMTHAKEARRISKKVYGDEREVSMQLKYAYASIKKAESALELNG